MTTLSKTLKQRKMLRADLQRKCKLARVYISLQQISRLCYGRSKPNLYTAYAISDALNVPIETLFPKKEILQ